MSKLLIAVLLLASVGWLMVQHKAVSKETNEPVVQVAQAAPTETPEIKTETNVPSSGTSKLQTTRNTVAPKVSPKPTIPAPMAGIQPGRNYSKDEVQQLIKDYSAQYGISPETPLCIARHESGFNQFSKNRHSTASGVFQYLTSTWKGTDEGRAGLSVFDADANVRAAVKYMAIHKSTKPWVVAPKCPKLKHL